MIARSVYLNSINTYAKNINTSNYSPLCLINVA